MSENNVIRSPFFYVGDKYKLMPQLEKLFPKDINNYIEPFVGGGSSFLNSTGKKYILNDVDDNIILLHKELGKYANNPQELLNKLYDLIDYYGLSCSFREINVPEDIKKKYKKTYYSQYNKEAYLKMRKDYNNKQDNVLLLYLLLIYGFNHMIRFNSKGIFNLPVGNVDFNKNVYEALINYLNFRKKNEVVFENTDYKKFLSKINFTEKDYVFLDPPYLISMSEYNKLWNSEKEEELCKFLDNLDKEGIKFGITNLVYHKGRENRIFNNWCKKYKVYNIHSNYISFNDNSVKKDSKEVFVTNYESKKK